MIPQSQSATSSLRRLCEDIQTQINRVLGNLISSLAVSVDSPKSQIDQERTKFQRILQELKSELIQTITYQLPKIITFEQTLSEALLDLEQQRDEWRDKYKKIFQSYEQNQLQNDKMKMEIVSLSQNYENVSLAFEEIKYKYCEIRERELEGDRIKRNQAINQMAQQNTSRNNQHSSNSGVDSQMERDIKMETEVMKEERQLFLQQIRQSQKEIIALKQQNEELAEQRQKILKENQQLDNLLKGEKIRSDRLDRQILEILNKNEDLKMQKLQEKERCSRMEELKDDTAKLLEEEKQNREQIVTQKDRIVEELTETKKLLINLKLQNSKEREKYCILEEEQRNLKNKINQMKKENQVMRTQIEKLIIKLRQTNEILSRNHRQEVGRIRKQYEEYKNHSQLTEKQLKTKNGQKLQQISKMHKDITSKLQHKIHLLEKDSKQKKQRIGQMKFEIERLYQSLQIQVEKQFKNKDKSKEMLQKYNEVEQRYSSLEEREKIIKDNKHQMEEQIQALKEQLSGKEKRLAKLRKIYDKLTKLILPKLKEQIYATRLSCQHFCKMIEMEKQQTSFFLHKRQDNFNQLIQQAFLQSTMTFQKTNLHYQNQLQKWKDHCKKYEQKYCELKELHDNLQQKYTKLEIQKKRQIEEKEQKISKLMQLLQDQKKEQMNTSRTVQKLKEKCREVEQYYKLVQDLSKQNFCLKNKLETSHYSFRSPEKSDFQQTSKHRKLATEESLLKYSKTLNQSKFKQEYNLDDLASKAEFQKMRLQAVKKEYKMVNRGDF